MSDLPAHRALDVAIAEKVMGLTVVALDWPCGYLPPCYWLEASDTAEPTIDLMTERHPVYRDAEGELRPVPAYSTDLAAAWTVVAHLNQGTSPYRLQLTQMGYPAAYWRCIFFRGYLSNGYEARGTTVPTAICEAALATLGQKE